MFVYFSLNATFCAESKALLFECIGMEWFSLGPGAALNYRVQEKFSVLVFIILIFFDTFLVPEDIRLRGESLH